MSAASTSMATSTSLSFLVTLAVIGGAVLLLVVLVAHSAPA
jgi:hypothetical protein